MRITPAYTGSEPLCTTAVTRSDSVFTPRSTARYASPPLGTRWPSASTRATGRRARNSPRPPARTTSDSTSGRPRPCQTARCTGSTAVDSDSAAPPISSSTAAGTSPNSTVSAASTAAGATNHPDGAAARATASPVPAKPSAPHAEPQAVGHGEHRRQDDRGQHQPRVGERPGLERREGVLLGDEAEHEREAGHRGRRHQRHDHGRPPTGAGPRDPPDVAGPRLVLDDARHQEQRRLEQGVRQHELAGVHHGGGRPEPEHDDHEPELADRAEGQDQLEVVLAQRPQPARDHRDQAHGHHERPPDPHEGERRAEPADQVHARLHHRGRVQVGADRRGRHHGAGQPRVERVLGRLGERPDEHQHEADGHRGPGRRVGQDPAELVRPAALHRLPDQHEPRQHGQTARPGDQQRLQGGGPRLDRVVVVADEQERRDRGQLPEAEQHDQVVGQDQAQHRAGEQHQQAEQPPLTRPAVRQVRAGSRPRSARRCPTRGRRTAPRTRRAAGRGRRRAPAPTSPTRSPAGRRAARHPGPPARPPSPPGGPRPPARPAAWRGGPSRSGRARRRGAPGAGRSRGRPRHHGARRRATPAAVRHGARRWVGRGGGARRRHDGAAGWVGGAQAMAPRFRPPGRTGGR